MASQRVNVLVGKLVSQLRVQLQPWVRSLTVGAAGARATCILAGQRLLQSAYCLRYLDMHGQGSPIPASRDAQLGCLTGELEPLNVGQLHPARTATHRNLSNANINTNPAQRPSRSRQSSATQTRRCELLSNPHNPHSLVKFPQQHRQDGKPHPPPQRYGVSSRS